MNCEIARVCKLTSQPARTLSVPLRTASPNANSLFDAFAMRYSIQRLLSTLKTLNVSRASVDFNIQPSGCAAAAFILFFSLFFASDRHVNGQQPSAPANTQQLQFNTFQRTSTITNGANPEVEMAINGRLSRVLVDSESEEGVGNLKIYIVRNSRVVAETISDGEGFFNLAGVAPGVYALCAISDNGFLAFGIRISEDEVSREWRGNGYQMASIPLARELSRAQDDDEDLDVDAAVVPPSFQALERIVTRYLPALGEALSSDAPDESFADGIDDRSIVKDLKVRLDAEGTLVGRMAPLTRQRDKASRLREMNAFLIQDDEIYARVAVEADGSFRFRDVEPGSYSFAAAGKEGFAAVGFRAIPPGETDLSASLNDPSLQYVSAPVRPTTNVAGSLVVPLSPSTESAFILNQVATLSGGQNSQLSSNGVPIPPAPEPSSNGGGGGGGLGLSGIGTAAFFAAGVAGALSDDGNGGFDASFPGTTFPGNEDPDGPEPGPGDGGAVPEPGTWWIWSLIAFLALAVWTSKRRKNMDQLPQVTSTSAST